MNGWLAGPTMMLAQEVRLTIQGGIVMVACIGFVLALGVFCTSRILREQRPKEHHHVPLDIDTHDT